MNITGVFTTTGNYGYLRLVFVIDNPYAATQEKINILIVDPTGNVSGIGQAVLSYSASIMGCSVASSSPYTSVGSTQTYTLNPSFKLIKDSYI
jgi:hypothetical protein